MKRIFALLTVLCLLGGCAAPAAISSAAETPSASSASSVPQSSTAEVSSKEESPPAAPAPSVPEPSEPPVFVSDIKLTLPEEFSLSTPLCFWLWQTFRQVTHEEAPYLFPIASSHTALGMMLDLGGQQISLRCLRETELAPPILDDYTVDAIAWQFWPGPDGALPSAEGLPELFPGLPVDCSVPELLSYFGLPENTVIEASPLAGWQESATILAGPYELKFSYDPQEPLGKTVWLRLAEPRTCQPYFVEPHRCEKELPEKMPLSASSPACDWLDYGGYELAQALSCEEMLHGMDGHPRAFLLKGEQLSPFFVPSSTADKGYVLLQREYGKYESAPSGLPDICAGLSFTAGRDEILSFFGLPADHPLGYGDGVDLKVRWGDREYSFWFDKDLPQLLNAVKIEMI